MNLLSHTERWRTVNMWAGCGLRREYEICGFYIQGADSTSQCQLEASAIIEKSHNLFGPQRPKY